MPQWGMEARQTEEITIEFLRQQHSMIKVEKSVMEDDGRVWLVEALASSFDKEKKITVKVNARTGLVLGWKQNNTQNLTRY